MNPNVKKTLRVVLIALACILLGMPAFAKDPKIAPDLEGVDPSSTVDVIIQFAHVPTARHHAMVMSRGGNLKARLDVVKGAAYRIQRSQLESLAKDPEVVYISPDRKIKGMLDLTAAAVNAPTAWNSYGLTGAGIGVAIIDSGLTNHRPQEWTWRPAHRLPTGLHGRRHARPIWAWRARRRHRGG